MDKHSLLSKLMRDVPKQHRSSTLSISTLSENSTCSLLDENGNFVFYQLLAETLMRTPPSPGAKREIIEHCRMYYKNNLQELAKIDEFELNYCPTKSIWWYTRDCFLYRLMNKALRTKNIDRIFRFRTVISDLHNQLCRLHILQLRSSKTLTVYRGQQLSEDEFNGIKNHVGGLISFNTFFSTTPESDTALFFAGDSDEKGMVSVLFEIDIENKCGYPYIRIGKLGYFKGENEILFSIGTVFRIEEYEELWSGKWYVKLSLHRETHDHLTVRAVRRIIGEKSTDDNLADFLNERYQMKDRQSIQTLLDEFSTHYYDIISFYATVGMFYRRQKLYKEELQYYEKIAEILEKSLPNKHPILAITYASIAEYNRREMNDTEADRQFCDKQECRTDDTFNTVSR
ncbi:unnamed protein product [Didymodactylos carnosus]|uniref:NAD(P)(+)--arginine ADP-ribosyltransferase n=1 Tax=Didymodactylos carnosus TaxID=1234261 RepID=A0A8S2EWT9_9BILA|nr:unnamed protein product [Didymodactylos carnosus]CAF4147476.1 unnamed protein product [Didymodactylos carnosus]